MAKDNQQEQNTVGLAQTPLSAQDQAQLSSILKGVTNAGPALATVSLSAADIANIITAAIRASKEPTADEQAKAQADAQEQAEKRAQLKTEADDWRLQREAMRDSCPHKKPRGEDCMIGKLFSDGVYRVMCLRCQKWIQEIPATPDLIQQVMQAENMGISSWENFGKFSSGFIDTPQAV